MALETGTYISDLVATNPSSTDPKSAGDDHLRLVKSTVKATFPNITGAVTPTQAELNYVGGVTSAIQTQINTKGAIAGQAWTGVHTFPTQTLGDASTKAATTAYVDGSTSAEAAIRAAADTALQNSKADLASPALTGAPTAPTPASGTNNTQLATTAFATQLAFQASLPVQSGSAGKYVTTNGSSASWAAPPGVGGALITGSVTLTSASASAQRITPSAYGQRITLPDATTCAKSMPVFSITNAGGYDVVVVDSAGAIKTFVKPYTTAILGLADNSTSAGTWLVLNQASVGISAGVAITATISSITLVQLSASKHVILFIMSSALYAVAHDTASNTFGAVTLVRNANVSFNALPVNSSQAIVLSVTGTAMQGVVLGVSGTTITVNTAATVTLAGAISSLYGGLVVDSSFVFSYTRNPTSSNHVLLAATVSGTTVTFGSELLLALAVNHLFYYASGQMLTAAPNGGAQIVATPVAVSGTTLTAGTAATMPCAANAYLVSIQMNSGRVFLQYINTVATGSLISVASNVATASTVALSASANAFSSSYSWNISATRALIATTNTTRCIITDTAGTLSVGSELTVPTSIIPFRLSGNFVYHQFNGLIYKLDISGGTPTLAATYPAIGTMSFGMSAHSAIGSQPLAGWLDNGTLLAGAIQSALGFVGVWAGAEIAAAENTPVIVSTATARASNTLSYAINNGYLYKVECVA